MTTARDIMTAGVQCVDQNESLLDAARMMRDLNVGSLPICGLDNRLHGIITDRDIVIRCIADGRDPAEMSAEELAGHLHWVNADDDVTDVLKTMEDNRIRRVPVIDDHRLVGMISEADLAQHLDEHQIAEFVEHIYAR
ncbi:hypoxic response protein Hrp1 [Saccharothrix violaceirubra]|uniref:CBS domain-containing protein n=1 Tax=Saccharothrix violaceirubra TaxID=413306 RepID=A0A7W7T3K1_9PSEU|nr:CBS domain-containing protein [Saccharothrix violaceirubra]MBB4964695.1 CBS domain-containing protein [Saccharothrix violaceirubra]